MTSVEWADQIHFENTFRFVSIWKKMSSRIAKSTIDWAKFASVVPKAEQVSYNAFKARSDAYLTRYVSLFSRHFSSQLLFSSSVLSYPENPPQINFEDYKNKVKSKDVVAQLEKAYKAVKIPYPKDTLSQEVDKQEQEFKAQSESYVAVANAKIAEADKLVIIHSLIILFLPFSLFG